MREFTDGTAAIVRGALDAGCDFFAGYPITPASGILVGMLRELPKVGGVAVQAEDEIASMGLCIGAALAGRRVMTATSGPGISLYSENIGLAIMAEVPMVIVNCQRLGPATGGATTVAQGDVQFVRWGTSGGYPVIALAPSTVPECYNLTLRAFDLAGHLRTPVFLLTDKEMVTTRTTVEVAAYEKAAPAPWPHALADAPFVPYRFERLDDVPPLSPYGGPHLLRATTSTYDEHAYLTKDPARIDRLNRHLEAKIAARVDELAMLKADLDPDADTLLLSYGITARAMVEAVRRARQAGRPVSAVTVLSLWPLPERPLLQAMAGVRRVVVGELNLGQYRREVERLAGPWGIEVVGVHRVDGQLIAPDQFLAALD